MHGPVPPASRNASTRTRQRSGVESESNSNPTPTRAARRAAVTLAAALTTGTGRSAHRGIARERSFRVAAAEQARDFDELMREPRRQMIEARVHDLEVGRQCTGRDA